MSTLADIRERDEKALLTWDWEAAPRDRRELLRRLDLALPYVWHRGYCMALYDRGCTCGLDTARREIEA